MSKFVGTKNINQCRTYCNKLLSTFKNVQKVIAFFTHNLSNYDSIVESLGERNIQLFGDEHEESSEEGEFSDNIKEEKPDLSQEG